MKKRIIALIAMLSLLLGCMAVFAGCGQQTEAPAEEPTAATEPEVITRPVADTEYETAGMTAVPQPSQETSKTIQWINMDEYADADLMMMATLQGNVNREQPSMYIIHDEIVEGSGSLNASQFWFDQLDETYTGADAFEKVEYTDPYEMIVANQKHISGVIIYHERLTDAAMAGIAGYQDRYSDIALLNLTIMMCGQYNAIAMNYIQYITLKEEYGLELEILGDTTKFMEKDEEGRFSKDRASRAVWERVYKYALDTFGETVNDQALAHNPGFQVANFDYFVANDMFVYNRIFSAEATADEKELELSILNMTQPNTPVFGCWYLQADEGSLVPLLTANYKYMVVSYESFNLSWTSGLPYEELGVAEETITLDPTKNYIAFTFSEGDNNSYLQFRMPSMFESDAKGEYAIGWTIAATCWETNPNIIRYCRMNWSDGDGVITPEAGVGYVYSTPSEGSQDQFFAISDEYLSRSGSGVIRMLQADTAASLPYVEKMENLDAVVCGYLDTGNTNYNNDTSHFLFRDTPVFTNFDGRDSASLVQADPGTPGFYMMSLYGWNQDPESVSTIMETLGEGFVAVTPAQLADLYRQYYGSEFSDVTTASFQASMTRSEMGFLYKATDYGDYDTYSGSRLADGEDYFIYKFDLADGVTEAVFDVLVEGNYQIEASSDYLNWTVMAKGSSKDPVEVRFDASSVIAAGQPLYIRFGDATPENDNGVDLYALYLTTDKAEAEYFDILCSQDAAYLVEASQSEVTDSGRKGTFTYRLPLSKAIQSGDLMIAAENVSVAISQDGTQYTDLAMHKVGQTWYAQLSGLNGALYVTITADKPISQVRFSPTPEVVSQISFSPVSNDTTKAYLLSLDACEVTETGYTSSRAVKNDAVMVYRFVTTADVTQASLMLNATGIYKLSVSNDGENYTQLYEAQAGKTNPNPNTVDITEFAAGGKTVYVKFEASQQIAEKAAKLIKLRLLTNLTTDALLEKLDKEREPNATVLAGSEAEISLLDSSLSRGHFLYENAARCMNPDPNAAIVYKYDTNSAEFFQALGIEQVEVSKLRISLRIGNAYKISISGDGKNWTEITDTNDATIQSATNLKDVDIALTEAMIDGVVYVKISRSDAYETNVTHDGLVWNTRFYIN